MTLCRRALRREKQVATADSGAARANRGRTEVVTAICDLLDELQSNSPPRPHRRLITFVTDRPGHDRRYATDASKISPNSAGGRAKALTAGCARPSSGTSTTNRWW